MRITNRKIRMVISVLFCIFTMTVSLTGQTRANRLAKEKAADKIIVLLPKLSGITGEETTWLPGVVKDKIEANVGEYLGFTVVDISNVAELRMLQKQSESDTYDEATVIKIGRLMNASYAFFPKVTKAGKRYMLSVGCTDIKTALRSAQAMSGGRDTVEGLFDEQGCAVDEITLALCEQLKISLTEAQKTSLKPAISVSQKKDTKAIASTKSTPSQNTVPVATPKTQVAPKNNTEDARTEVMRRIEAQKNSTHKMYDKPSDFTYKINDAMDGVIITGFSDSKLPEGVKTYSIVIPDEIEGLHVVGVDPSKLWVNRSGIKSVVFTDYIGELPKGCFSYAACSRSLESVVLPACITTLERTFRGCTGLKTVYIPDTVTAITGGAFSGCKSLESVNLPSLLTVIGSSAFSGCEALKSIELPPTVEAIGRDAFYDCKSIKTITLPTSVKSIGAVAFSGCEALEEVIVTDGVKIKFSEGGAFDRCPRLTMKSKLALKKAGCDEF